MYISDLISSVSDILYEYYNNSKNESTSSLVIGGNTININIVNNKDSTVTAEQVTKLAAYAAIIGKFCLVLNYPTSHRIYLAVLMGLHTKNGTTPKHYSSSYASKLFGDIEIGDVKMTNDKIQIYSQDFGELSLEDIRSYIKSLISQYESNLSQYDFDSITYVEEGSSDDVYSNAIYIPIKIYHALICRYLMNYVKNNGESKVALVVLYSVKVSIKTISSSKIVNVTIYNNDNASINFKQYATATSEAIFGIDTYDLNIDTDLKIPILICTIICVIIFIIFGGVTIYYAIKTFNHIKEINFKMK